MPEHHREPIGEGAHRGAARGIFRERALHLHPRRVAPFFGRLLELGRDNQIIAATTSAELLATVRPEQVIDLGQA